MKPVTEHKVTANVRADGALGLYETRPFWLMLADGTPDQQAKEAIRILRQIGWETRGVTVEQRA